MYKISNFVLADGRISFVKSDKSGINSVHMVSGQFTITITTITIRDVMMTARICSFRIKIKITQDSCSSDFWCGGF